MSFNSKIKTMKVSEILDEKTIEAFTENESLKPKFLKRKATSKKQAVPKQENCKKKTKVDTTAVVVVFCKEAKKEDKKTFFRTLVLLP